MLASFSSVWRRLRAGVRVPYLLNNGQQPPDLDELWRDFNQRLGKLFGQQSPAGGEQRPNPNAGGDGQPPVVVIPVLPLVLGAALVVWLGSGSFIVQEGQQAVVTRLGKLDHTVGPGFGWHYPWPVEKVEIVDVTQLRSIEIGVGATGSDGLQDSSMLTRDENIVDVRLTVQYNLKNPAAFLFHNANTENAVSKAAESAVREVVGRVDMDTVLNKDREAIQRDVLRTTQAQLDRYGAGVVIRNVNIQNVQPPAAVQAAFDDALKAGQDRDRLKNQGQAYANRIVAEAKGQAVRMVEEAQGYKARIIGQAQGDTQRFDQIVVQYQKAPQVTRERMYLDAMQELYSKTNKVLLDSRGSNIINVPLDKMLGSSKTEATGAVNNANAAANAASNTSASGAAAGATTGATAAAATLNNVPSSTNGANGANAMKADADSGPAGDARNRNDGRSRAREVR